MTTRFTWADAAVNATPASARFEEERVKMTLEVFGLLQDRFELLEAEIEATGVRRLTFQRFRERFPTFPVLLDARYIGRVAEKINAADLFRRFETTFVTDHYLEVYSRFCDEADGRPIGLVLPFDGVRSGVVVHNGEFDTGTTRMVHTVRDDEPHRLTVERFSGFLKFLAAGEWSPTSVPKGHLKAAKPTTPLAATVAPWMVERLGTGPAAFILGWFTAVLDNPSRNDKWVCRTNGGERYVSITHEEMSAASGLSEDALKRGLRKLKDEALIQTFTKDRRTCIVLIPPIDL